MIIIIQTISALMSIVHTALMLVTLGFINNTQGYRNFRTNFKAWVKTRKEIARRVDPEAGYKAVKAKLDNPVWFYLTEAYSFGLEWAAYFFILKWLSEYLNTL